MDLPRGSSTTIVGEEESKFGWEAETLNIGAGRERSMGGREGGEEES